MFNVTVAAEFPVHAKTKYTELYLIDKLFLGLMYAKKITRFCQVVKKDAHKRKLVSFYCLTVYRTLYDGQHVGTNTAATRRIMHNTSR